MPYIYKITNKINNKIYIGKTLDTIENRWKSHIKDSKRTHCEKRPLYSAFKKYGIENFIIEEVEHCSVDQLNEREVYWIEFYRSFKNGYNATRGGDGKSYCDYDLIYSLHKQGMNLLEISQCLGYSPDTCSKAIKSFGVSKKELVDNGRKVVRKTIIQLDKDTEEILRIFPSLQEACDFLGKQSSGHISDVCKGKRKTAYGYKWKYGDS